MFFVPSLKSPTLKLPICPIVRLAHLAYSPAIRPPPSQPESVKCAPSSLALLESEPLLGMGRRLPGLNVDRGDRAAGGREGGAGAP